ncbi:MAG TPA: hypothetical protein VG710_06075 [Opitutus sp.]|nr:hypothetical protein [Opitutus sp.]
MSPVASFAPASNRFRSRGLALSAAAGAGCALATVAQAQIVYSGVKNISSSTTTQIDFDSDGTFDAQLNTKGFADKSGETAEFVRVPSLSVLEKLSAGSSISSASALLKAVNALPMNSNGGWNPGDTGYVGFSFVSGASTYYGWGEIDYTSSSSTILVDWAYNSTAGGSITAGQMPTAVPEPAATAAGAGAIALGVALRLTGRRRARARAARRAPTPAVEARVRGSPRSKLATVSCRIARGLSG